MTKKKLPTKDRKKEDIKRLVIERIKAGSRDLRIAVGSKTFNKTSILQSIQKEDSFGRQIVEAQISYLKDLASGKIYQDE
ncbi:MAG TPA: hypothetical protein VMW29_03205 [Candidatus Bathyarchaeia archaeon]|nr:hypothetical protein [Candidatus Bathyarchaeia archaeon]